MKKGQKIIMYFKCAGVVSDETLKIKGFTDTTVTITDDWQFDRKTGKCLNDNTSWGASRYISPNS